PARILPGTGWLLVIDHPGGGRPWWVWEDLKKSAATYVFRPSTAQEEHRL
ncbi:MAG: hypothetical protein H6740_18040, partial [Alphaproteobacteria bacterium]|nr:hypothetical protein [Alphaproteobacteria bacterium]